MQPGDYLIMQFGHNDQKQIAAGTGGPFTTYREEMKKHIAAVRAVGGVPIVVSPMERRNFDAEGRVAPSLADYAKAARETAAAERVAFIDLNAMSIRLYEALGPEKSAAAFAAPDGKVDNTHHNNFGSYELARCVARGIAETKLPLAEELVYDLWKFDPARPDDPRTFAVPPSPNFTNQRPLGD
jgi:lysophospholipase L1-like esterase